MLNIYRSNRTEHLMAALCRVIQVPPQDPMQPEWIGVQSKGMKQWITLNMARHLGVCANVDFLFPRRIIEHILNGYQPLLSQNKTEDERNADFFFWSILKQVRDKKNKPVLSGILDYIRTDTTGKKEFQVSRRIARAFDDYQIYRPQMLLDWESGKTSALANDPAAAWQAALWKHIHPDHTDHLSGRIETFLKGFSPDRMRDNYLPPRLILFGISALPIQFLQVFDRISDIIPVHLFFMVPTHHYFSDIQSSARLNKIALQSDPDLSVTDLHYEIANPLLASLGKSIKSFSAMIEGFEYQEPGPELFDDPAGDNPIQDTPDTGDSDGDTVSMLSRIQSDILNLIHRCEGAPEPPLPLNRRDRSIQIHACHSPMRETQVLKDLLLNAFETDTELAPHDVIVMMPDIESYSPFIESCFSTEQTLPYSISDRRKRSESEVIHAFLSLLALPGSRFEKAEILDLLSLPPIAGRFRISQDELATIEQMVDQADILWGKNGYHRKDMGLPGFEENTWETGLERLFLGMAMPESRDWLFSGILPCQVLEGLELEILGKFAAFYHTLVEQVAAFKSQQRVDFWCSILKQTASRMIDPQDRNTEDLFFLYEVIDRIRDEADRAGFQDPVSFEAITLLVEQKLDLSIAQGSFMTGRVTFCNIMPMRSIPFKLVVLMGMDESAFPRKTFDSGFDLIRKYPMEGDKIQRDEDRYLFLEALLSARSQFIITYTGRNIRDNSLIPCSGVVSELIETISQSFDMKDPERIETFHPLHPFDPLYFSSPPDHTDTPETTPDLSFLSYSADHLEIARTLFHSRTTPPVFVDSFTPDLIGVKPAADFGMENQMVDLTDVIRFFKHPLRKWVHEGLGIQIPELEAPASARELFSIKGLDQFLLGKQLLEKNMALAETDFYAIFKAMGRLPYGAKGRVEYEKLKADVSALMDTAVPYLEHDRLPPVALHHHIAGIRVSANFADITRSERVHFSYGRLNASRLMAVWVEHLFLNLGIDDGYPKQTVLIGRNPSAGKPPVIYRFPELASDAPAILEPLLRLFVKGSREPVWFFCDTGWQFVRELRKKPTELTIQSIETIMNLSKVKTAWLGSAFLTGESRDRVVSLCVENNDPFQSARTLLDSGFIDNAMQVFSPLLDHLEIKK